MKQQRMMMQQAQKLQEGMARIQAQLEQEQVEASAGGGAVKAVASGQQRVLSINIASDLGSDLDMLQDLVVVAVNEALEKSKALAATRMQEMAAGMGLPPGLL